MARITPTKTVLTFTQYADDMGNYYPCCIYSNALFTEKLEASLIVSLSIVKEDTKEHETIKSILNALSDYKVWKEKKSEELPEEIKEHFNLLPDMDCNMSIEFYAFNNVPTDIMFFSYEEIQNITKTLMHVCTVLKKELDTDSLDVVKPIADSFDDFYKAWNEHKRQTNSLFANQEILQ